MVNDFYLKVKNFDGNWFPAFTTIPVTDQNQVNMTGLPPQDIGNGRWIQLYAFKDFVLRNEAEIKAKQPATPFVVPNSGFVITRDLTLKGGQQQITTKTAGPVTLSPNLIPLQVKANIVEIGYKESGAYIVKKVAGAIAGGPMGQVSAAPGILIGPDGVAVGQIKKSTIEADAQN